MRLLIRWSPVRIWHGLLKNQQVRPVFTSELTLLSVYFLPVFLPVLIVPAIQPVE